MRELIFKNLTSNDHKKRDIRVQEIIQKDDLVARTERRSIYFVRKKTHIETTEDLKTFTSDPGQIHDSDKKHFFILKEHNSSNGRDMILCKVRGTMHVVVGDDIFTITFFHTYKIDMMDLSVATDKKIGF
ncbi:MAG: hypothetical protein HQ593_03510 [Candidatus Omnitrophica bacterium]|nr:hypothetical protein [Candidatus Omnitrophota bacterium]